MSKDENNKPEGKEKSFFSSLIIPILTALVVGGTAPWWVDFIKGDEQSSGNEDQISSVDNSKNLQPEDTAISDDAVNIEGSESTVSDNSITASDQSVIQQSNGSGSNISAGRDLTINEISESSEISEFSGEIGNFEQDEGFTSFLYDHDAEIVYLDVYFDPFVVKNDDYGFTLYSSCRDDLPTGQSPGYLDCVGTNISVVSSNSSESLYQYVSATQYLKGYWSVRSDPGIRQGYMTVTLTSVDTKDVQ
jgi:hypothetical protein